MLFTSCFSGHYFMGECLFYFSVGVIVFATIVFLCVIFYLLRLLDNMNE
nr:MAG TPA: hypothetical protein [Caudoviricetes sp.]